MFRDVVPKKLESHFPKWNTYCWLRHPSVSVDLIPRFSPILGNNSSSVLSGRGISVKQRIAETPLRPQTTYWSLDKWCYEMMLLDSNLSFHKSFRVLNLEEFGKLRWQEKKKQKNPGKSHLLSSGISDSLISIF